MRAGESFRPWLDRVGGSKAIDAELEVIDHFLEPETAPDFYIDYDEFAPLTAEIGESECAT